MEGEKLLVVEEEKDLGVIVHQNLKPSAQVAKAAKKANQILGQLLRAFTYRDSIHFIKLYKVYVRCHMEYAVQTWNPYLENDKEVLENVQRRAIRQVSGLTGSYEEKLEKVGLTSLVDRRMRGGMIQTFKIMHQLEDIPVDTFFQVSGSAHNHATRQATDIGEDGEEHISNWNLDVQPFSKGLDVRQNFYSQRVVSPWNCLPLEVKSAESVNQFKNLYDDHYQN